MKKKTKLYLRLNLISLFFVVVSFISVTLAWFVYSGLSSVSTEVAVKAWYIELEHNGKPITNNVVISLDDIYPGMKTIEEEIKIKNYGDSDAQVKYEISSIRILDDPADDYVIDDKITSEYVEDKISHDYPFHINIDLSKNYVLAQTDEAIFKVSISWPLDSVSDDLDRTKADELDSYWGTKAYNFKKSEQEKKIADKNYQIRASIKLDIKLTAEQFIENENSSDKKFRRGNEVLFDVAKNEKCTVESTTCSDETCCIRTNIIDVNNKIFDDIVTLLPKTIKDYPSGTFYDINTLYQQQITNWKVNTRLLSSNDILKVISKDIKESVIVRDNVSDLIIGNLNDENRINSIKQKTISTQGYYKFLNKYSYFVSNDCYWINEDYGVDKAFAIDKLDESSMKLYGELKTSNCKVIPVLLIEKEKLK